MHTLLKTSVLAATTGVLMLSCSSAKEMTAESLNGEWNVIQIEAQKITPAENTPVVGWNFAENRLYGSTGCNRIMGQVTFDDLIDGKADFTKVMTTMMACPDNKFERPFLNALNKVKKATQAKNKVKLLDADGQTVLVLAPRDGK